MIPGQLGNAASNDGDLMRMIQDLQREMRELRAANPFAPMGMTPQANGVVFSGSVEIDGNLSVPNGSISNAALQNPIAAAQVSNSQTNFATTASDQDFASSTIPVPTGFSTALVFAVTSAGAINSTTSQDYLYASTSIQGVSARQVFGYAGPSGGSTAITTARSTLLTGLSGGNIAITARIHSGAPWAANASNRAYVEAQAIFLR